jgi:hypothetical protein
MGEQAYSRYGCAAALAADYLRPGPKRAAFCKDQLRVVLLTSLATQTTISSLPWEDRRGAIAYIKNESLAADLLKSAAW